MDPMDSLVAADNAEGPSRGARKRAAILEAAQQVFFANGFVGASMDQVAATAAVSKQTVYKHFSDKEALFREVVTNVVRVRDGGIAADFLSTGDGTNWRAASLLRPPLLEGSDAARCPQAAAVGDRRGGAIPRARAIVL